MFTKTGETAVSSRTSTPATLEKPSGDASPSHDTLAMENSNKEKTRSGVDDAPTDVSDSGGFIFLMTVTALAMSMFLVRLDLSNTLTPCETNR